MIRTDFPSRTRLQGSHTINKMTLVATFWMLSTTSVCTAQITDDFTDGQWDDGSPIAWSIVDGSESYATVTPSNSLRLDSANGLIRIGARTATDTASIRAQVRLLSSFAGLSFPEQGHWAVLNADGQLTIGRGNNEFLDSIATGLDPLNEEVILQMDWVGNTVSAWAWSPNNPPTSEEPQVKYVTSRTRAFPSIFTNFGAQAEFRSVTISAEHIPVAIPEPSSLVLVLIAVTSLVALRRAPE